MTITVRRPLSAAEAQRLLDLTSRIASAKERLKKCETDLATLNKEYPSPASRDVVWKVEVRIKKGQRDSWGGSTYGAVDVDIPIPIGVVQQALINKIAAARRDLVALEMQL